jgi:hypothetical protein
MTRRIGDGAWIRRAAACAVAGCVVGLPAGKARAADWGFVPKVALSAEYDDNVRLNTPGSEIDVTGGKIDAELRVQAQTPTSTFQLIPRLRSTFYPGDPEQEADDQFLRMAVEHETTRTRSGLALDYSRMTTLGGYFPNSQVEDDDDLGEPEPGVGVGEVGDRNRQERILVAPEMGFDLSERTSLNAEVRYLDVTFDRQDPGDRQDFADFGGTVTFRFRTTETTSIEVRGGYARFEPEVGDNNDRYGIDAEWTNQPTETAEVYVRGGMTRTRIDPAVEGQASDWEDGFTGGAGVRWKFEVSSIFLDVTRFLDPNSSGEIVTRDQVRAQWSRALGPMLTVTLGARVMQDSGAFDEEASRDREYAAGTLGFEWRVARDWSLYGLYNYRWKETEGAPSDAESNAVSLGVVYEIDRRGQ